MWGVGWTTYKFGFDFQTGVIELFFSLYGDLADSEVQPTFYQMGTEGSLPGGKASGS
jgi:hypothetical protein